MDNLSSLDWTLVRAFLAVAETGSLSAAARALGSSQPTLGRQVREAEAALGVELFQRHAKGLSLTQTGQAILPAAQEMQAAAGQIALIAAGQDERPTGTVRVTASVIVAHFVLPPILARLRAEEPGIVVDLVATDSSDNLLFREADIAVRMYRPDQLDMVTRHVTDLPLGIFAAKSYLDRRGQPETVEEALDHDWVGYDRSDLMLRGMRQMGWPVDRDFFAIRTDDQAGNWQLIRAGCGIGIAQIATARDAPEVERLLPDMELPALPVWLTAHEAMRRTPRIARVWDALAEGLATAVS
ncbi:LysR family transcriptional regulator [Maritimibacter sp. UBA3975]|uniref:LysR family transcriptional regulator n=1 Tax=Maritimibacter sp. UBA3975 TaxID=1946833 RepID=UPI000C0A8389|nr:LysR family transcriptional regulator [Maritimibacter sp. UBA3975]MAM63360.1 LysR family transcriptional regulator [Maritimibacter sp.]|tara:strand:- start:992 stop:1885 length:894 start_codon:yes stop_codon:yes gene_type:complete